MRIQEAVRQAVAAIQGITVTIGEIDHIASRIASAVEEQGAATQEIARNVQQAAAGTQRGVEHDRRRQAGATDTGAAAAQVLEAARQLSHQAEALTGEVDRFVVAVRAAESRPYSPPPLAGGVWGEGGRGTAPSPQPPPARGGEDSVGLESITGRDDPVASQSLCLVERDVDTAQHPITRLARRPLGHAETRRDRFG